AMLRVTEQRMHGVDPERFYMRFSSGAGDGTQQQEAPLKDELSGLIIEILQKDFNAEVIAVNLKMGQTELTKRWAELQRQFCDFEVKVSSRDPLEAEDVTLRGTFRVEALDYKGWNNFQNRAQSLEHIRKRLEAIIESHLDVQSTEVLAFRDPESLKRLADIVVPHAEQCVCNEFGLSIKIDTFMRERTELEAVVKERNVDRLRHRVEEEAELDKLKWTILAKKKAKLYEDLAGCIETGEVDESRRVLEAIKELDSHLPNNAVFAEAPLQRLSPRSKARALPGNNTRGQNTPGLQYIGQEASNRQDGGAQTQFAQDSTDADSAQSDQSRVASE
ncbi:MAG: hypothetical protein ACRD3J_17150, partial [Thermoanaerobaculia bacterium]